MTSRTFKNNKGETIDKENTTTGIFRTKTQARAAVTQTTQRTALADVRNRTTANNVADQKAPASKLVTAKAKPPLPRAANVINRAPSNVRLTRQQSAVTLVSKSTANDVATSHNDRRASLRSSSLSARNLSTKETRPPSVLDVSMASVAATTSTIQMDSDNDDMEEVSTSLRPPQSVASTLQTLNDEPIDPQQVTQYVDAIYAYMKDRQRELGIVKNYLAVQRTLGADAITGRMRAITCDWLVQVAIRFHISPETLYLSVQLLDRFLNLTLVPKHELQLVGVTCLMIACKYEEIMTPELPDYVYITDNSCSASQIKSMEIAILRRLDFKLGLPLPLHFLRRYSKITNATIECHTTAKYFMEQIITDYSLCHITPSMQAAIAMWLARAQLYYSKRLSETIWPIELAQESGADELILTPYARLLAAHIIKSHEKGCKLNAIREKYSTSRFVNNVITDLEVLQHIVNDTIRTMKK